MVRFQQARGLMLAGAALIGVQAPAWAQDQEAIPTDAGSGESIKTTKTDSGDIIVTARHYVPEGAQTATKTNIPLIETPQSITVITRDQIDLLSFIDLQQAVRYTAGAFGENYGPDPRYDFVTVRGFTPKQYIDGLAVPATTTIASIGLDLYAFQSVDILKGPASVLYGSSPPGGIINEVTRRPSSTTGGELRVKYGSYDYKEVAGTITGAAAPFLDIRLTGMFRDNDREIKDTHDKRVMVSPSATLKLGSDTKLTGLFYYQYDDVRGGAGGFLPIAGTRDPNPNGRLPRSVNLDNPADRFLRKQFGAGFDFEHRFNSAIRFESNTKWTDYSERTPIGLYSANGFTNTTDPALPSYFNTLSQADFTYRERVKQFASDNRFDIKLETGPLTHKLLAGLDYRNVRSDAAYGFFTVNGFGVGNFDVGTINAYPVDYSNALVSELGYPLRYNLQRVKQTGVYGQDQIGFDDRLFLLLSGRYDWVKQTFDQNAFGPVDGPTNFATGKQHKFTYRAGLTYVTDFGIAPYVSYATSFEPIIGTDFVTGNTFNPTSVRQWEGGFKFDSRALPSDIKLSGTAAVFAIREKNFVSAQVSTTSPTFSTQGGEVEAKGAEFELVARVREQLTLNASYSYTTSEVKSSANAPADVGLPLPVTPKHKASFFADYTFQSGLLAGFGGGGGVRYTSSSTGGLIGPFGATVYRTGEATLVDGQIHYDLPGWRFGVNASNLLDKRYVARCASAYGCVYGAGRQVLGTVTKRC